MKARTVAFNWTELKVREVVAPGAGEQGDGAPGKEEAEDRAGEREEQVLGKELTEKAEAGGAQGAADGDLFLPGDGAREEQVGDVGAGDQEDDADGAEQEEEGIAGVAEHVIAEGGDGGADLVIGVRVLLFETGGEGGEVGAGLLEGDAGLHAPDGVVGMVAAEAQAFAVHGERGPHLRAEGELEGGGHDAHDFVLTGVEFDGLPDGIGVAGVAGGPQAVTEDDDVVFTGLVFAGGPGAPDLGRDAEEVEEIGGGGEGERMLGAAFGGEVDVVGPIEEGHVLEGGVLGLPIEEVGAGEGVFAGRGFGFVEADELLRMAVGEGPEEDCVDDAEDGGIGADSDGQRDGGNESESPGVPQVAEAVLEVEQEGPHVSLIDEYARERLACDEFCHEFGGEVRRSGAVRGFRGSSGGTRRGCVARFGPKSGRGLRSGGCRI